MTHALGGEMVCSVDGELQQSKASHDLTVLEATAEEWKQAFLAKGWTA